MTCLILFFEFINLKNRNEFTPKKQKRMCWNPIPETRAEKLNEINALKWSAGIVEFTEFQR